MSSLPLGGIQVTGGADSEITWGAYRRVTLRKLRLVWVDNCPPEVLPVTGLTERVHDASKLDCHLEDRKSASRYRLLVFCL